VLKAQVPNPLIHIGVVDRLKLRFKIDQTALPGQHLFYKPPTHAHRVQSWVASGDGHSCLPWFPVLKEP
jgi:hypothetical protein